MTFRAWLTASLALTSVAILGCPSSSGGDGDDGGGDDGFTSCNGDTCIELYRAFYSTLPCDGAPDQTCTYANAYFVVNQNGTYAGGLTPANVSMTINGVEVGSEGAATLRQESGLLVDLLLDQSYSITQAGAAETVKAAAKAFLNVLPPEAYVSVGAFASEDQVPLMFSTTSAPSTSIATYYPLATNKLELESFIDLQYTPYPTATSDSFTKFYDALYGLVGFGVPSGGAVGEELLSLQNVVVAFTDGSDTASTTYTDASSLASYIGSTHPEVKVYALGLGTEVDPAALNAVSDGRAYFADDATQLQQVFEEVSNDLAAIYQYRILVSETQSYAEGQLNVLFEGTPYQLNFVLNEVGGGSGTGPGPGPGPGDGPVCGEPCEYAGSPTLCDDDVSFCIPFGSGAFCQPSDCYNCTIEGLICNWDPNSCTEQGCF